MIKRNVILIGVTLLLTICITITAFKPLAKKSKGLKDYYQKYFPIGVAVAPYDLTGANKELIIQQFNSVTAENAMKMGPIHPAENEYNWKIGDSIAAFARKNNLKMRGHCLVWYNQAPRWFFKNDQGNTVTKEELLGRLKEHIHTVVNHYKKDIYAWDVVNEVIADDSTYFRNSQFYKIAGEDFVEMAFRYAHEADPKARLFYNDYNTEQPKKRDKIYKMIKALLAKGVPIHGIGLQGHWSVSNPSRSELEKSISLFASLGLDVQITELDVSVYEGNQGGQLIQNAAQKAKAEFTPEMESRQLEQYKMIFEVLRKYKKNITGVTFWNLSDRYTWLDRRGKKNYPLLFDTELKPKKAFYEVTKF
ncbi:endo-1,4-beta-xylanase [Agrobacterium tumefaciens]|nr:endo-1,4-beta-xylanase [Agrobacterium tumefaciens]NTE25237.1 endo-1,4-beta-xylanase [Agrobacterium tumefaciens]